MFEVAGSLSDFYRQSEGIKGLEFLLEDDIEIPGDDDFHLQDAATLDEDFGGKLYMAMPDVAALRELVRLWDLYRLGQQLPWGSRSWTKLFQLLRNLRPWGPDDRVLPETLTYWKEEIASDPNRSVRFEIELWFHSDANRRDVARERVAGQVTSLGGAIASQVAIEPIRYQALLVDLPPVSVLQLLENPTVTLARLDEIMYLRPQSVVTNPLSDEAPTEMQGDVSELEVEGSPVAALIDGVPVANHLRLSGRLIIDDPANLQDLSPVATRSHGTAMASLILHGDLQAPEPSLKAPLVVAPIMVFDQAAQAERTPSDRLPLDVVFTAITRLVAASPNTTPVAPSVAVINLSVGDMNRPFSGKMSPWARLIDWLSFEHRLLFLVSAGNITSWLPVRDYSTIAEFAAAAPGAREDAILRSINDHKARRSLLSPAEAMNAVSVGAWHDDNHPGGMAPAHLHDPFPISGLPNVSSGLGLGYRRAVKPELLLEGGRELVRLTEDQGHVWIAPDGGGYYSGQLAAAPDSGGTGQLNLERRSVGSSNATALATRGAVAILSALEESGYDVPRLHRAVLLKALLTHGASWGDAGTRLETLFGAGGRAHLAQKDNLARFLGYGKPDFARVVDCTMERATLFSYGDIGLDTQDEYDVPLPPSIEGVTDVRRLTITLAWLSPVNVRHQRYRSSTLAVLPNGDPSYSLAVERQSRQPSHVAVERGTLFHSVFEGDDAVAFLDNGLLRLKVTCRAQAGALRSPTPYAIVISLETAVGSGIGVYEEMRAAIAARVRTPA